MYVCIVSMRFSSRMIPSNKKKIILKTIKQKQKSNQTISEISKKKKPSDWGRLCGRVRTI